jgi:hypothetical protein
MQTFSLALLIDCWASGKTLVYNNRHYRVGRMSYGDFFLEPGKAQGETKPFNPGTLWLKRLPDDVYKIAYRL